MSQQSIAPSVLQNLLLLVGLFARAAHMYEFLPKKEHSLKPPGKAVI
jgi:hypothetical protein